VELEIIAIVISVFAFIIAGCVFPLIFFKLSRKIAQGNLEIQIRNMIREANVEKQNKMVEYEAETNEHIKKFKNYAYCSAIEWYLNFFEDACALAIDGKIDSKRFKKTYYLELGEIIKNKKYATFFVQDSDFKLDVENEEAFKDYVEKGKNKETCYYHKIFSTYYGWEEERKLKQHKNIERELKNNAKENNKEKSQM